MPEFSGQTISLIAAAVAIGNLGLYWLRVKAVRLPDRATGQQVAMMLAGALAVTALMNQPGWVGGTAATIALLLAAAFLIMTLTSGTPSTAPAVEVGHPAIDFTTTDSQGDPFTLSQVKGRPVLLKFFRGHW